MPTYEYRCGACGHLFEKLQSFSEKPIRKCPECGKLSVKRLISSGAGIIFKGSGFYQTDYKKTSKEPSKPAAEAPAKPSSETAAKPLSQTTPKKETPKTPDKKHK